MNIRTATYHDAPVIKSLLEALDCKTRNSIVIDQLESKFNKNDNQVLVCEMRKEVVGFVAVHFIPQLAIDSGVVFISYLSVDELVKGHGIEKVLEEYVVGLARERKCERIQVHSMDRRTSAHQFYLQQGYEEYQQCFIKRLVRE